jgi:hypothetical protein
MLNPSRFLKDIPEDEEDDEEFNPDAEGDDDDDVDDDEEEEGEGEKLENGSGDEKVEEGDLEPPKKKRKI